MDPELPHTRLPAQNWFLAFMATKGFRPSGPETFSNGKATIQIREDRLVADPGTGDKRWQSDVSKADQQTITLVVDQILKTRPFLTDTDVAKEQIERQRLQQALEGIATSIQDGPDTSGGVQLRRFLWSLYNQHHLINLWRMTSSLDSQHAAWVSQVFAGALTGILKEADLKCALATSGEMSRWDREQPSSEAMRKLDNAEHIVSGLAQATLPSRSHTEIADLLRQFANAKQIFQGEGCL